MNEQKSKTLENQQTYFTWLLPFREQGNQEAAVQDAESYDRELPHSED